MILRKKKKNRIKLHFELIMKVRSGCVRRRSDAKELTAKPSAWLFGDTVFKRLDSGDVKILNRFVARYAVSSATDITLLTGSVSLCKDLLKNDVEEKHNCFLLAKRKISKSSFKSKLLVSGTAL